MGLMTTDKILKLVDSDIASLYEGYKSLDAADAIGLQIAKNLNRVANALELLAGKIKIQDSDNRSNDSSSSDNPIKPLDVSR
jgi:hypothetical protein